MRILSLICLVVVQGAQVYGIELVSPVEYQDAGNVKRLNVISDFSLPSEKVYSEEGYHIRKVIIPAGSKVKVVRFAKLTAHDPARGMCRLDLKYGNFDFTLTSNAKVGQDPTTGEVFVLECAQKLPSAFAIYQY